MRERERERCQGDPVNNIFTQRKQVRQKEERRSWPHGPSSCRFYAPVIWRRQYRRRNNTSDYLGSQLFYGLEISPDKRGLHAVPGSCQLIFFSLTNTYVH